MKFFYYKHFWKNILINFLFLSTFIFPSLSVEKNIPVIEPVKESIKDKPNEVELFPNSDSSIWSAFKNAQEERENNINNNSNQNNIEKENTGVKINTQEDNTSEDSSVNKVLFKNAFLWSRCKSNGESRCFHTTTCRWRYIPST